ncbi:MAG: tetratricopeptide repeat-containing protein [Geminicoccaceae bacterium]
MDYAAASARVLRSWLEQLAEHQGEETPRLRLLLLERHASAEAGWWAELTRFGGFGSAGLMDLVDPPVPLPSLRTLEQRRQVLGAVMTAACALDGIDPPLWPPAPGADPYFEARLGDDLIDNEPLYLMMAGLTAVRSRVSHVLTNGRKDLARTLARAEIERIGRLARDRGLDGLFLQHLAACVTLTDGIAYSAAAALALEEQQALQQPSIDGVSVAAALADALSGPTVNIIEAIRPNLIGEAAIIVVLELARRSPEGQAGIIARAWGRAPAKTMATVVRAAQDYAPADGNHSSLVWLQHLAQLTDDPLELIAMVGVVPTATTSLRGLGAEIQRKIVDIIRANNPTGDSGHPRLAMGLNNLANRLSALGRRELALNAAEEAVSIYRDLTATYPDAFLPDLATALNNLARFRCDLGQRESALKVSEEAVVICRKLATVRSNAIQPNLAMALNNLAITLRAVGRLEPALEAAEEALQLFRELAASQPDAFRPNFAKALNNLANTLSTLGQHKLALQAAQEAAQLYRELSAAQSDAFRPDFAMALNNLTSTLSAVGQRESALEVSEEAVAILRELAAARPDAFRPGLANALNNLANLISDLGQREPALNAAEEVVQLYRELAAARPDAFRPDLAMAHNNLSLMLSALDRHDSALHAAEEAVAILRELTAARPHALRPDLARSLAVLANCLESCDRQADALAANREAITTLAPAFVRLPAAFAHWMLPMVRQYLGCCKASGSEPDGALLEPLIPALMPFVEPPDSGQDEGERG